MASIVAHGLLLLFVVQQSGHRLPVVGEAAAQANGSAPQEPTWIDVTTGEDRGNPPLPAVLEQPAQPVVNVKDVPEGDRDRDVPESVAPRVAAGREAGVPATDRGVDGGRPAERAWRRDQSTLHDRVTDGSSVTQPSRQHTAARESSLQAVRREPTTGTGDSAKTQVPARLPVATQFAHPEDGTHDDGSGSSSESQAGVASPADIPHVAEDVVRERGQGPLDAEAGSRAFDTQRRGPAADAQSVRSASNERHPSITEFSRAGAIAPVDSLQGRGPGQAAGATARLTRGTAPNDYGAARVEKTGPTVAEPSQDRRYQRYVQEIIRRVNSTREFPKSLALRLEQGETIVYFVLRTDGKISDGVRVVKSSGFDEFDSAATRAVLRAAPFPPMPDPATARPLPISVRVAFENPVVR
jgi:TonB family protein